VPSRSIAAYKGCLHTEFDVTASSNDNELDENRLRVRPPSPMIVSGGGGRIPPSRTAGAISRTLAIAASNRIYFTVSNGSRGSTWKRKSFLSLPFSLCRSLCLFVSLLFAARKWRRPTKIIDYIRARGAASRGNDNDDTWETGEAPPKNRIRALVAPPPLSV